MKSASARVRVCRCALPLISLMPAALALAGTAEILTLKRAVQLALAHSPASLQASADEQRAFASYREAQNQYLPQFFVGSGLGYTQGYPLSLEGSAPSLFNVTAQSALFNPALRDFIRAARFESNAVASENKDRRTQIVQDTVLTYLELVKWESEMEQLRQQHEDALKAEQIVTQRVQAGVDREQTGKQAQLATARAYFRLTQAQGAIDVLRSQLSQLTGVPVNSVQPAPDSVPRLPDLKPEDDDAVQSTESNPSVLFAQQHAMAASFRARGEHRSLWPSADFATQYAVLAQFNNWTQFFPRNAFQRNNATVGVVLRFPFLNPSQHAHAEAADAEALGASKQVQSAKDQVSQQTLKLRRSVDQLQAAQKVSELEYEIAQSNADAVEIRINSGTATVNDRAQARRELSAKYNGLEDANFELLRARISLMRATGELESWVNQAK
jgi:outer membrane protein TolC